MSVKIIKILDNIQSDVGAPSPKVIADEFKVVLVFYLQQKSENNFDVVRFTFNGYKQFKFGSPNDETISGHPYYKFGLKPYSINLVENSDWIQFLEKQNSVHEHHDKDKYNNLKHYIFFFHDSCFEIVCANYQYELVNEEKQITKLLSNDNIL